MALNPEAKWEKFKDYLAGKDAQILSEVRGSAREGRQDLFAKLGAQLSLLEEIRAHAEQLDRGGNLVGRLAPKEKY